MDVNSKICQLWQYLKIKDDEIFIIPFYNKLSDKDDYAIATMVHNNIVIQIVDSMPELTGNKPFYLFQHIGADGKHKIPSVEELKNDEKIDY